MLSCRFETKKERPVYTNTDYFSSLLKVAFGKEIDSQQHFYLLVTDGCHGCVGTSSKFFHALITEDSLLPISIIVSKLYSLPEEVRYDKMVLLDTTGTVDRCRLLQGSVCLVEVHDGKVDSVRNFDINDVPTIQRYIHFKKRADP